MHNLHYARNALGHLLLLPEQIEYQSLTATQAYVSIYLCNCNSKQRLPCVSGKRKFGLIKQTELLFGHSEGSQAIWLIESLKRAGDRIIEKAEVLSAVSKKSRALWLVRYC